MIALSDRELLLAYTDFEHADAGGLRRKAVLVRKATIQG
jgi:hypothetical protein